MAEQAIKYEGNDIFIKKENDTAILDSNFSKQICYIRQQIKELEEIDKEYTSKLLEAMEQNKIIKLDNDDLTITYVPPTDRETFDSKSFKDDFSQLYDEYVTIKPVKASIRIKVK